MPYLGSEPAQTALVAADITDDIITTAKINADAITNAKIADDQLDSEHYVDGSVDTAHLADDLITLAKLAGGTDGNIISYDASGDPVAIATGTDGQVLTSTGAGSPPAFEAASSGGLTLGTEQATTSGTSVTFSSIPAGTKVIYVMIMGYQGSNNDEAFLQIGDSGGIETSGYLGSASQAISATVATDVSTDDWEIDRYQTVDIVHGTFQLTLADTSNTWTQIHIMGDSTANRTYWGAGQKPLSEELTQIKFGVISGALAAGSVNIMYS